MGIVVVGTNETVVVSSSQSSTAYTSNEKSPFGTAHTYGVGEDSFGFDTYGYGFVEHILKEGTIHVS